MVYLRPDQPPHGRQAYLRMLVGVLAVVAVIALVFVVIWLVR